MNSLLKRQIKKYLDTERHQDHDYNDVFLAAVNDSYINFEAQIVMLQRAMRISSEELFEANKKLREEAKSLKEINKNLEFILSSMSPEGNDKPNEGFNATEYIKKQSAEIIEINRQREELLKNLETQNQELNEYAHVVSHDLKSPLRNVNTLINWMLEDDGATLTDESKKSLGLVLFNVEKMDLTIKGILDYSSIDKLEYENRNINFNILISEILRTTILPGNISLKIDNKLPSMYGNYARFKQLFQNLIDNAIRYNDKDEGLINIGCRHKDDEIEFYIKDNGEGINEAYFDKIFNVFTKLSSENHSSGMGLSIAKKIVSFYGGEIWLKSTPTEGTTFFFTLKKNGTT
ncbi:GHKL domain-containing protein [Flavobacterium arcticum]|uniref:histidine kinase n=1 Tax=Flavobacterium arcticum TaxID=1784713 RepID=A0A345H8H2_9FLAO|nr:ATP-binding protein [Flavobacterium arcticum]AXG72882.1 GHKL domain-containing protein [Flavobacterium arcticum]KAF2510455.1 GHKL domain-containing protein [Flavobacterium arcticum]